MPHRAIELNRTLKPIKNNSEYYTKPANQAETQVKENQSKKKQEHTTIPFYQIKPKKESIPNHQTNQTKREKSKPNFSFKETFNNKTEQYIYSIADPSRTPSQTRAPRPVTHQTKPEQWGNL
jgi:hypothetical protein